jgi:membrane associated rhomboid family serine protease
MPATSPVTYGILALSCIFYGISLLWTLRLNGTGGFGGVMGFDLGGIDGSVLQQLGASLPLAYNLQDPWRFVMAVFLHGSLLHIGFNMLALMNLGPLVEELYGSARYLFIYVLTGISGYVVSSFRGHFSVGGSGAIMGLVGVLLGMTFGRQNANAKALQGQLVFWTLINLAFGFSSSGIDNYAHIGGLAVGFLLGRILDSRPPMSAAESKSAGILGWASAAVVLASIAWMAKDIFVGV